MALTFSRRGSRRDSKPAHRPASALTEPVGILELTPTPFFGDKNRAFWRLQLLGWGGAMLLRSATALANDLSLDFLVLVLIATITGFSLSLILSVIYGQLINRRPLVTWGVTALSLAVAVFVSAFINAWTISLRPEAAETSFTSLVLGVFYLDMTLLGAWSALYYAINYFLRVEEQNDRLLRLEAQATAAQLAMLRYQLNPHFLFNTLNSISTLVLLKQTEPANAMLIRLSGFLRHTLVTQPGARVTVAQEVETLHLYLGIERMRFEERLRTEFNIDPAAAQALIPSMLLQPLIENAIKYGVSAQEEGARITLSAQVLGRHLRITVSDTGPGLQGSRRSDIIDNAPRAGAPASTGVGLANIRDRLAQAYGEDHRFAIETPAGGGFTVFIEIPYEREEPTQPLAQNPAQSALPGKPPAAPTVDGATQQKAIGTGT
ncbi:sensor histidine kinase [Alteraurantiacibacter buctensis]|uniref:Sensor histidine kinase n=1 Tax=Alteraurantiacibacter buctensis TaxID=1503981 RepID=A0A844YUA8_9SPHN|nr:histidine kinase [Alteraurantiacibacter buctensis]MXO70451.1 sensor histidine kinase [Alteraurantiacibacter buctensis]